MTRGTSRMERYASKENNEVTSRTKKNQKVYEDLYTSTAITNFSSSSFSNAIDLSDLNGETFGRRELYQRTRDTSNFGLEENSREILDYQYPKVESEIRDFDINRILQEAKENRNDDELEKKRKLKTTEYNILVDLNEEKLKEYRRNKKEVLSEDEEKNLEELIHTITSKTMAQDVKEALEQSEEDSKDENLLDDLMPTKLDETVISSHILNEIENSLPENISFKYQEERIDQIDDDQEETEETGKLDQSFYTKSMDLSKEDLISESEKDDDEELFLEENKSPIWLKVIVSMIVLLIILGIGFVVYQALI